MSEVMPQKMEEISLLNLVLKEINKVGMLYDGKRTFE